MPRGAAVVYPKDAAQILMGADIFPGARVIEAGAGSGALTCSLLRAIGPTGRLDLLRAARGLRRDRPAERRRTSSAASTGRPGSCGSATWWRALTDEPVDRVVLDMLAPWECVDAVAEVLVPGRGDLRVRGHHDPAGPDRGDAAGARRVHRAGGHRDPGPGLARRGPGRTTAARHGRPHRVPGHSPGGWRQASRHRYANVAQHPARTARITTDRAACARVVSCAGGVHARTYARPRCRTRTAMP